MIDIQAKFTDNASKLTREVVALAINEGVKRAEYWKYPDTFWTTSVRTCGYDFDIHKPEGKDPGILHYRKYDGK